MPRHKPHDATPMPALAQSPRRRRRRRRRFHRAFMHWYAMNGGRFRIPLHVTLRRDHYIEFEFAGIHSGISGSLSDIGIDVGVTRMARYPDPSRRFLRGRPVSKTRGIGAPTGQRGLPCAGPQAVSTRVLTSVPPGTHHPTNLSAIKMCFVAMLLTESKRKKPE